MYIMLFLLHSNTASVVTPTLVSVCVLDGVSEMYMYYCDGSLLSVCTGSVWGKTESICLQRKHNFTQAHIHTYIHTHTPKHMHTQMIQNVSLL